LRNLRQNKGILIERSLFMPQNAQQILNQISQIARQLEQQEAMNAQMLQGQEMSTQQQQQMANLEQTAAQKLGQIQQLLQQYQQLGQSQQSFQSSTGARNGQISSSQSIIQPGFAGTDAEEVRRQNQQSTQNQSGGNAFR
jgi:YesN/AraC family two-component response regulator